MKVEFTAYTIVLAVATVSLTLLSATPAKADFTVCNQTDQTMNFALVHRSEGDWWSRGWYVVSPGGCQAILTGELKHREYYLHAHSSNRSLLLETVCKRILRGRH